MAIELKNVSFSYQNAKEEGLFDINLKINDGEFVVLIGESGSGKTTVTRIINGVCTYSYKGKLSGEVLIDGKNLKTMKSYELAQIVGSVFQNPRTQFFNTDTDSELAFGLENAGENPDFINQRIDEVTQKLHIENLRNRDIFKLSGGEKQKIAFASIYATNPRIYVLDEPSSNLDEKGIAELKDCLALMKNEGKTVVIAEHRLYYLADLADRFVYLKNGKITEQFTKEDLLRLSADELAELGLRSIQPVSIMAGQVFAGQDTLMRGELEKSEMIEIKSLTLFRKKKIIIEEISLKLEKGKVYGVIGQNGKGKTTFLRTLSGLHKEYKGEIFVGGVKMKRRDLQKKSYLLMQDVNYQLFADSVYNECTLGIKNPPEEKILRLLLQNGLFDYKERHPNTLSGGQKQRLSVVLSAMYDKELILFDEPTSGLDANNMRRIASIIQELKENGKYVIVVSHDYEFVNLCCDEVVRF